jgi:cytochrome c-type biogenesis protein CcmH/NrfG
MDFGISMGRIAGILFSAALLLLVSRQFAGQPDASSVERGFAAMEDNSAPGSHGSIDAFRIALSNDPASPFRWCDLGEAYLIGGDLEKAEYCYRRGAALAPHVPAVALRLCNFQVRTGATDCLADLLTIPAYREMVLSDYTRLGLSPPGNKAP